LVSQSRVLPELGARGSDDLIGGERRDQPTTKAMADKNDANVGVDNAAPITVNSIT
jgi:hypothetical protein